MTRTSHFIPTTLAIQHLFYPITWIHLDIPFFFLVKLQAPVDVKLHRNRGRKRSRPSRQNLLVRRFYALKKVTRRRVRRVTVYPRQRAATCKIYSNTVKSHHERGCEFRHPPAAAVAAATTLYLLRDTSTCDYLLTARSCRGRGDPSKRVSDIHASVQTHQSPVARNMRSGDRREHEDASNVHDGHLCDSRDTRTDMLLTNTRSWIDRESRIPFTFLIPRQLKKSFGWEHAPE